MVERARELYSRKKKPLDHGCWCCVAF
uniref:Uncharacterized protein n=1 Tax=Anopheles minimus TaxID=112268 RepID=A0A182WP26_9DIPT